MGPWIRRILKSLAGFALLLAMLVAWLYWRDTPSSKQMMGEHVSEDEAILTPAIIASAVRLSSSSRDAVLSNDPEWKSAGKSPGFHASTYRRDVHSKTHGCLAATFEVLSEVPAKMNKGLFGTKGSYPAWIRFSNGTPLPKPDYEDDARGMAIKVMGVPGNKLLPGEELDQTQDFLMINNTVFFIPGIEAYAKFGDALAAGKTYSYFFGGGSWNPMTWHLRQMMLAKGTQKKAPDSLLAETYHSLTAYALGSEHYVKYGARPCSNRAAFEPNRSKVDFLREGMAQELSKAGACFDFMVQPQIAERNMPVEDATVEWKEKDSPFQPVARIRIEKQQFDTEERNRFCENLSFNPWHALPEHRPVGVMNRVRKELYLGMSRFRRCKNERSYLGEPQTSAAEPWKLDFDCKSCEGGGIANGTPLPGGCEWKGLAAAAR
jgi:hypothetical protein